MILLIDVGNTRIKWCVAEPATPLGDWLAAGALEHAAVAELRDVCRRHPGITRAAGTNVAGAAIADAVTAALDQAIDGRPFAVSWLAPSAESCDVRNGYDDPSQLGADRWAALIGARALHSAACLVVTAGTATTVDLLAANGRFEGGVILPGLDLMRRSLSSNTAQLPFADGRFAATPRRTADAIVSGCLHAQAGAVERMFRLIADQPGAACLLNGGSAHHLAPLLGVPALEVDNLVLRGLAVAASRSQPPASPDASR